MSEKLTESLSFLEDEETKKDAASVHELLKTAKILAEDVFGEDASFNDVVTVYSLLKSERLTRLAKDFAKMGRGGPPGLGLIPIGQSPFGGNGGVS